MSVTLFEEMKEYVGFGEREGERLRSLKPLVAPHFDAITEDFYARILSHPGAAAVLGEDSEQMNRLRGTLKLWLGTCFEGPWDEAYFELRSRIGRQHVKLAMPQHYMFTAMALLRTHLCNIVLDVRHHEPDCHQDLAAVNKILDLELGIMLHTYQQDYVVKLQRQERLATFGQLSATIAHELRNPLGVIESSAYLVRRRLTEDAAATRHMDKIEKQARLASRIIGNLLDIIRDQKPTASPMDVRALVRDVVEDRRDADRTLEIESPPDLPLARADEGHLRQIVSNLIDNAIEATGAGGTVRVVLGVDAHHVTVLVSDDGPGIDPEIGTRLFEPLVTSKPSGAGLGLALCRKLAEAQDGSLTTTSGPLPGASFLLELLRAE